jgi:oxygen-independent coproporphyrinogen-3 oxidase
MNYWNNEEYYGFGAAAHGYVNRIRYSNCAELKEYLQNPTGHDKEKFMTDKERMEEEIFLGFRRMKGINVAQINEKFGVNFEEKYNYILGKYEGLDLLQKTDVGYRLTPKGVLLSNVILAEFID